VVLSISVDGCRAKLAFLEAYALYTVAVVRAIEESGDRNIALFPASEVTVDWGMFGWDMVRRRKFEWDLLEEHALWDKNQKPGPFEQWLDIRNPDLFRSTGRPGEHVPEEERSQAIPDETDNRAKSKQKSDDELQQILRARDQGITLEQIAKIIFLGHVTAGAVGKRIQRAHNRKTTL
jgi:hypothetical protein